MTQSNYFAIHWKDFEEYGCPVCGSDYAYSSTSFGHEVPVTCGECGFNFLLLPDEKNISDVRYGSEEKRISVIEHPRKVTGVKKHAFHAPDIRPEVGEYWHPRGIGYDLSGFVKSKEAGERIVKMFKKALNKENIKTWLDFRPREPTWIQVKVQEEEADLEKLYELTKDTGIITQEIVNSVVKI